MLGKVLQNFQQVGIYNQFCKAGRGCRCPSSSTGDIKSYVAGWGKPCFNVSASFSTKAKVSQTSLQEKVDTERWENLKARSNTTDGELVINNGSKVNNSLFYRDDSDFDEPIFIHPSRECGAAGRLFSTRPKISRHKSLDNAISTYRVNICGRRTFSLNDPGLTKLIHKQGFLEQSGGNLFLNRFYHVLNKDGINYSNTSLVSKRSLSTRSECNIVTKLSVKDKSNVEPPQDTKKGTVYPDGDLGDSSHEPQTSTRYVHAFHPKNVEDSFQAGSEEDKLLPEVGRKKLAGSGTPKSFSTSQSNDVLKPDRRSDSVYKIQLGAKSPPDLEARSAYSTSSEDADVLRRADLERKDPRAKLPDQCAPKRNMSSVETKASQKGDPPSSGAKMELQGKKKAKAKPPPKKKGKKAAKKKKPKKKVCGSQQSSKISCLDVCHTRTSCNLKAKKKTKAKPQKCLGIGCRKGLGGFCYKLKNMFKRDRKCKLRKGKK